MNTTGALGGDGLDEERQPLEIFIGTDGPDNLVGTEEADEIDGLGGDDKLSGLLGDDQIFGRDGADEIRGGQGDDDLRGGPGADRILGGLDDDTILAGSGADKAFGGDGNDRLEGSNGSDRLVGEAGDDVLFGQAGKDTLEGRGGNDNLNGGGGDDILNGGNGQDILDGRPGADVMTLGGDADVVVYTVLDNNVDRVLDFVEGVDRFDLSAVLPNFGVGDAVDDFVRFEVVDAGTRLAVDPSGSGDDANFRVIALLEGVSIDSLPEEDLGLNPSPIDGRTIASANGDGVAGNGTSFVPELSTDGQFVSFASDASNLVGGAGGDEFDIFRKDLVTGEVIRVADEGARSGIAGDGDPIVYETFGGGTISIVDLAAGTETPLNDASAGDFTSADPSISTDGTVAAFVEGGTVQVSRDGGDPVQVNGDTNAVDAEISPDGATIGYATTIGDFVQVVVGPSTGGSASPLTSGNADSLAVSLSADARFVAFQSAANNLDPADTDGVLDIYVADTQTGDVQVVSTSAAGVKGNGDSWTPAISDDGRFVAFRSAAENLTADGNGRPDIFVKDLETDAIVRFEIDGDTTDALPFVVAPEISGNGAVVAFVSDVSVVGIGGIDAGQVIVEPVVFGEPETGAPLVAAEVLSTDPDVPLPEPEPGPEAGAGTLPRDLAGISAIGPVPVDDGGTPEAGGVPTTNQFGFTLGLGSLVIGTEVEAA